MKYLNAFLSRHSNRLVGLDILRAIAILLVMYSHGQLLLPEEWRPTYRSFQFLLIDGVSLFFVLSGFLIGGILLKTLEQTEFKGRDLRVFWIRRWFRTLPNYFLVLALVYYFLPFNFEFSYLIFSQNLFSPHPSFFPEAWSLTIEEWFYLLFPLSTFVLYLLGKKQKRAFLISAIVFLFIPFILRILKFESGITDFDLEMRKVVIYRLDSIMYGILGAYLMRYFPQFWRSMKYPASILAVVIFILLYLNPAHWKYAYPPLYFNYESIATLCLLPLLADIRTTRSKWLDGTAISISVISYSMYLINLSLVMQSIIPRLHRRIEYNSPLIDYALYWILTLIGSVILYTIYEKPMTNLREMFSKK